MSSAPAAPEQSPTAPPAAVAGRLAAAPGRRAAVAALLVAISAAAPFAGTLGHGFALDDVSEVVRNEDVHALRNVPRLFGRGAWDGAGDRNPIYRPLSSATYALNHAAGGLDPAGYHLVNVLLHVLVALAVLALGRRLGLPTWAAALGAIAFAVHPVHVEVVANVAGRKDELAALFVLLAVLAHAEAMRRGRAWMVAPVLAVAAALFSKESGAAAIAFCAAWDVVVERPAPGAARRRAAALYGAYAAVFGLYLWARAAAVGSVGVPLWAIPYVENPLAHLPYGTRLLTGVAVLGKGLALLGAPHALSPDYSWDAIPVVTSAADPRFVASAAALVALAVAAARLRRDRPVLAFSALCWAAAVLPASNLLVKVGTIFGERLLYLPSVAACVAAAAVATEVARRTGRTGRLAGAATAAAGLVALATITVRYAACWRDEVSLFEAAVHAQPRSAKAHALLGAAFMEVGRVPEGIRELERSVQAQAALPTPPTGTRIELGVAYERAGRLADAEALYAEVLRASPDLPDALWRMGDVRWAQGRRDEAARLWERTLAAAPDHARAMIDLGIAAGAAGDDQRAEALWLRAAALDPRASGPWLSLGALYEQRGDLARARAAWHRFLDLARYGVHPGQREAVEERLRRMDGGAGGAPPGGPR